ncbi:MAG: class II fructose-bisphosphate aldolase [Thermomicrobiales bacterium]
MDPRTPFESLDDLRAGVRSALRLEGADVRVVDDGALRDGVIDRLIFTVAFGPEALRPVAIWLIWKAAPQVGAYPASIHELYMAAGRGDYEHATTPAINIRGITYDNARAIFSAAMGLRSKIAIFEIARSEMSYTWQRPGDYAASVLAGAIKVGYRGPVFIQGDHFQAIARFYEKDPAGEIQKVKDLCAEAIAAGFFNIDIDASTLVDISLPTLDGQQEKNCRHTAELTAFIRAREPEGVRVSIGGEIGEVGHQNSTFEDLRAFMRGYAPALKRRGDEAGVELAGISKISVQTGTSHGGIVLADGTIKEVSVDFGTLAALSAAAKREYGLGGAVQHGASTLPEEAFGRFAEADAVEVHLATAFQNLLYDHPAFPADLKSEIYAYLTEKAADERKPGQSDAQFFYGARKRGFGPFKRRMWEMPEAARTEIVATLQERYSLMMTRLGVAGSAELVDRIVAPVEVVIPAPPELGAPESADRAAASPRR